MYYKTLRVEIDFPCQFPNGIKCFLVCLQHLYVSLSEIQVKQEEEICKIPLTMVRVNILISVFYWIIWQSF